MITVDLEQGTVSVDDNGATRQYKIGTPEAFKIISDIWLRAGWDNKYVYSFTWLGRPIIQLPEDLIRLQELIYAVRPDVIVETGVAHGGSLVFYASLCKAMDSGRVIGVDIEGSSVDQSIVNEVKSRIGPGEKVMVLLDSCHEKQHVLAELAAYAPLVTPDSYIVAMDGIMEQLAGAPRSNEDWVWNNPRQAAIEFVAQDANFVIEEPPFAFNEGTVSQRVTYWPSAFIKRLR
jgi:cephalosporin hydroxylase